MESEERKTSFMIRILGLIFVVCVCVCVCVYGLPCVVAAGAPLLGNESPRLMSTDDKWVEIFGKNY